MKLNWPAIAVVAAILLFWIGVVLKVLNSVQQQKHPEVVSVNIRLTLPAHSPVPDPV